LEGLVVDEGHGVEPYTQAIGDGLYQVGLVGPADLWVEEELIKPECRNSRPGRIVVVLAGDGLQDAAVVQLTDDVPDPRGEDWIIALQQCAAPQRVVEVPDHALYRH